MSSDLATSFASLQSAAKRAPISRTDAGKPSMTPRCYVLFLAFRVGNLSSSVLTHAPLDDKRAALENADESDTAPDATASMDSFWTLPEHGAEREKIALAVGQVLWALVVTAEACSLDLEECIRKKLALNARKYPVELCKGKSGKYTAYSHKTGITKTEGQSTLDIDSNNTSTSTVEEMTRTIRKFATERLWSRFHSPRSLVLALMGELGELAELFQWIGDGEGGATGLGSWTKEDLDKVGQELADVTIYLLRLADVCHFTNVGVLAREESGKAMHLDD